MFENVLGQPVIQLVSDELEQGKVPPALLFAGPESSGKLTAALETARILSCTESGSWTCTCESCKRHKDLSSSDLLILGTRDTVLETKAAAHALCTAKTTAARYLFVRAVRKLTSRFDSRLWDTDESRFVKAAPILADIEESLTDLIDRYGTIETTISEEEAKKLEKLTEKITDLCQKLQEDCMYDTLPVNQVRKASAWVRLMPVGKKKVLIIENADKMQESARNAFLKILEEPPEYTVFILTTARRAAVIPTILSRVRTYLFIERDTEHQQAVIERVFRDHHFCTAVSPSQPIRIVSYLQSFLPVSPEYIREAAALFWEYCLHRGEQQKSRFTVLIQKLTAYRAEHPSSHEPSITAVLKLLNNCKPRRIYALFLEAVIAFLQESIHTGVCTPHELESSVAVSQFIHKAMQSVDIFNGTPQAALETLSEQIAFT
ncbi:hypothetical protein GWP40_07225 [Treponema vincentii]|uniref:hypothetical protein n=1 Tax=Treponema TaxID=157 RepID=UPI001BAEAAC7|nr:hypothetical protein [Treponema vincentii]QUY18134.1 hypothetical protein GWP40_07225 [Treponema vincentii]